MNNKTTTKTTPYHGTIGVFAPSYRIRETEIAPAYPLFESYGYRLKLHPQALMKEGESAIDSDHEAKGKADAFHDLLRDPEITAIMCARGGNRALHFLDAIDWKTVQNHPKPIMGFSDNTALLGAITCLGGTERQAYHGPTLKRLTELSNIHDQLDLAFSALSGRLSDIPLPGTKRLSSLQEHSHETVIKSRIFGGNLSLITRMIGTQYLPDLKGAILYLEDIGDETSWLDRDFWHLREIGTFDQLSALILGEFSAGDSGATPFPFSFEDILREHIGDLNIPVLYNAPFGHGDDLIPLPFGQKVRLDLSNIKKVAIHT